MSSLSFAVVGSWFRGLREALVAICCSLTKIHGGRSRADVAAASPVSKPPLPGPLRQLGQSHRAKLAVTYGLLNVENLLRLSQPFVVGLAIDGLLRESAFGLLIFVGQHLFHLAVSSLRQMYDTRVFTKIHGRLATEIVMEHRSRDVGTSCVAARSTMAREFVDFFEFQVPLMIRSGYSVIGALVMLAWYDPMLVPICLGLLFPAIVINRSYARRTFDLSQRLHDQLEHEVDVIDRSREPEVAQHFGRVAETRIKLSDCEAINFGVMELFVLGVMVVALLRTCSSVIANAGAIFAVFRYVTMLLMGLDAVPKVVQQWSRLRDLSFRLNRAS